MFRSLLAGAAVLSSASFASAQSSNTACGDVATAAARFTSQNPDATVPVVDGELAIACLQSVPLQTDENKALLQELRLYLSWQSSLSYLNNPPQGFTGDRVNIEQSLTDVESRLDNGEYSNEYDFMFDVHNAIKRGYDFHLNFIPDILNVFNFQRGNLFLEERLALFSMSSDGSSVPEVYNYFDLADVEDGATFTPSTITEINGASANEVILQFSELADYHDSDTRYNRMFFNQAGNSYGDYVSEFTEGRYYPGPSTNVTYSNGTTVNYPTYAIVRRNFDNIETGRDFFRAFCNRPPVDLGTVASLKKRSPDPSLTERQASQATPTGFPDPVMFHSEGVLGGYYLPGQGFENVAVLSIPSFGPEGDNGAVEFQNNVQEFLANATGSGKTRLVVDLRSNGGGRVFLGYDLFKQLFPREDPWGATRFRANDAFNTAGEALSDVLADYTYEDAQADLAGGTENGALVQAWRSIFNYRLPRDENNAAFTSWQDLFGPHEFNGDQFTSLERYDFNNVFADDLDMDVSGYGTRANALGNQPFDAENIVLLQDGMCGSTCAVFAELVKAQGRVQQIVFGGKPELAPMQGVTGSKGAQVLDYLQVVTQAAGTVNFLRPSEQQRLIDEGSEIVQLLNSSRPLRRAAWSASERPLARINLRDNIRQGDTSQTPLEFVYEAADCRLFYTRDMVFDPTAVWRATTNARWNNGQGCVQNSTQAPSSVSGGSPLPGSNSAANGGERPAGQSAASTLQASSVALVAALVASFALFGF